ncbi:DUF2061 domain-containing protein [Massilia sp. ST3]|uniref:DUF2061 domain-containing protein n=1 Tax=Massilia sp. ST3 TaxID=2824903 RepID=UPI001B82CBF9|nr:DUF2061 domain-containing protein [Massilia sp. ST3]MBQ5950509.1 DUF2061 domain-containing protein [Massilia sp. ST3]
MVAAAKRTSQVFTHMGIAFAIAYAMTGSLVFGGLAIVIEPVINVLLLPFHEKAWTALRQRSVTGRERYLVVGGEKLSQAAMHMVIAFSVMYAATGSLAFGGMAALLEPVCNVLLLPVHDRFWDQLELRVSGKLGVA